MATLTSSDVMLAVFKAHGLCYLQVAFGDGIKVKVDDVGEKDRVAFAMGATEEAPQTVGHGVHRSKARVGKGQSSLQARQHDPAAKDHIVRLIHSLQQVSRYQLYCLKGMDIGNGRMGCGDKGLDRMTEGIQSGKGSKLWRAW